MPQNIFAIESGLHQKDRAIDSTSDSNQQNAKIEQDKLSGTQDRSKKITWYSMFTDIPYDYYNFYKECKSEKEIPSLVTLAILTGSFMTVDQNGWNFQHKLITKYSVDQKISNFSVGFGNGEYQLLAGALFASTGLIFKDETAIRTGSNVVEAVVSTGLLVQLFKRITGRESPSAATQKGGDWDFVPSIKEYQKNQPAYYSFPSGHLATATAVLIVIANNYPNEKWIKPVGYPLLGALGFSLVSKGMHWYSDLPLAYYLGYSLGNIIAPERKDNEENNNKLAYTIFPTISLKDVQIHLLFTL
jgi:membrane-associated phospholipid phosphatase